MKKILFVLTVLMLSAVGFAGEKCDAYQKAFTAQLLLQTMQGNEQSPTSMYPMLYICFWEGFSGKLDPHYSKWSDEQFKKVREDEELGFPSKKGFKLYEDIFDGNLKVVESFIRSGEFSATGVIPCLLSDDMRDEMGSYIWNAFKNSAVKEGVSREMFRFVFLDRKVCKAWGSRKVTKDDLR